MGLNAAVLVGLLCDIGAHDEEHRWSARPFRWSDRDTYSAVIDAPQARGRIGWVVWMDESIPVLAVIEDRVHWSRMSVRLDADPFRAMGQAIAALHAAGLTGADTRPN